MSENRRKPKPAPPPRPKEYKLFNWLGARMPSLHNFFGEGKASADQEERVPIRFFYYLTWIIFLLVIYERIGYFSERNIRESQKLKREVEDARAEYTSIKAEYMKKGKQSEIAQKVVADSLMESLTPPNKLVIPRSDFESNRTGTKRY